MNYVELSVLGISTAINAIILTIFLKWRSNINKMVSKYFQFLNEKSVEVRQNKAEQKQVDKAIDQIVEGVAMENPMVQGIKYLVENYTDLELDGKTIMMFMQNPMIQNLLKQFAPNLATMTPNVANEYGRGRHKFKDSFI